VVVFALTPIFPVAAFMVLMVGLLFLPWAGLGLWLAAAGFSKKRGSPKDPSS
jgi:hypothetical protein